jgi:hypothetical protein
MSVLLQKGYKRELVLEYLSKHPRAKTPSQVYKGLRKRCSYGYISQVMVAAKKAEANGHYTVPEKVAAPTASNGNGHVPAAPRRPALVASDRLLTIISQNTTATQLSEWRDEFATRHQEAVAAGKYGLALIYLVLLSDIDRKK